MDEVAIKLLADIKIIGEESDKCVDPRSSDPKEKEVTIKYEIKPTDFSGKMIMEIRE